MGITASIDISAEQHRILLDLIHQLLPNTSIWAFGSRVKWTTRSNSDLDLVAFATPQQAPQVSALKEAFEESNLPFRVDLLVWDKLPENFQRNIQEEYVVLVEGNNMEPYCYMNSNFPEHWQQLPVEDVMEAIIDYRGKTPKKVDKGIPLVTAKIVKDGRILEPTEFIAENDYESWMVRGLPKIGDVVVTSEAPLGEVAQLTDAYVALAQRIVTLRGKRDILNNDYLLCAMQSSYVQNQLEARASGSTVRGIKQSELRKVLLPIPPENEQIKIANHIKSLSNKIELNRQTNQTLEQIAQALFKSWFVDFEPVKAKMAAKQAGASAEQIEQATICAISGKNPEQLAQFDPQTLQQLKATAALFPDALLDSELGEIPEGWEMRQLSSIIHVIGGGTPMRSEDTYWNGDIPWFSVKDVPASGDVFVVDTLEKISELGLRKSSTKLLPVGTTIITARGTVGKLALVGTPMCMNQSCYGIRGIDGIGAYFNYFNLREAITTLQQNTHGAVFDTITTQTFDSYSMAICVGEITQKFDEMVKPILERIESNVRETIVLGKLRDSLLPKLLSGELSINPESPYLQEVI